MTDRSDALTRITALAEEYSLSLGEIRDALNAKNPERSSSTAMRLFAYLGGVFIFAGLAAYIAMFWENMSSPARVVITLGTGIVCFIIAVITARNTPGSKAVAPLLVLAALLQPSGMIVFIAEYIKPKGDGHVIALIVLGIMLAQQAWALKKLRLQLLMCTTLSFGLLFFATAFDWIGISSKWNCLVMSTSILLIIYGINDKTNREITGFWYGFGSVLLFSSSFSLLRDTMIEPLYLGLSAFMVYISVLVQSTVLLSVSVLALLCYIGYFTAQHFANSVGWPITLLLLGVMFFAISNGAMRIKKKYLTQ